jgi:endonuclease/exonuclease/phosphatase family metal-dependent hydrolase
MQLITWNLNGLEDKHLDVRTEAAMFQMLLGAPLEKALKEGFKPNTPDIVLLQEVVERSYHAHIKTHFEAAGFTLYPQKPSERSYFEVIATRLPVVDFHYQSFDYSDQGRGLSSLKLENLTVMTAHMESMKPGSSMRLEQAKHILETMNASKTPCIFAGDTNLRKAEWESLNPDIVTDAWESTGSIKTHRFTWQMDAYKARYDRIWTKQVKVNKFEVFGGNKISSIKEASSDHKGIRLDFDIDV